MASPHIFDTPNQANLVQVAELVRIIRPDGSVLLEPPEWEEVLIEVLVPVVRWQDVALDRNGVPLSLSLRQIGGSARVVANWPRSGPGRYRLRAIIDGGVHEIIAHVRSAKLSADDFGHLIEDVQFSLPLAVALALQRAGGLAGIALASPREATLAEELERLRRAVRGTSDVRGLTALLRAIARDPHHMLSAHEPWLPRESARRPAPAMLSHALLRPGNLTPDSMPLFVVDARVQHTVDVYENRLVRAFVGQVERRLRRVRVALETRGPSERSEEALQLLNELRGARREAAFLDDVSELTVPPSRVTMVLQRRQDYRALFEAFLRFRRGLAVRMESPALDAPLEGLPYLYQLWGTMKVLRAFLEVGASLGWRVIAERLIGQDAGGYFFRPLPDGAPAVELAHPDGRSARLIPERTYRRRASDKSGLRSMSFAQRPDVAVEVARPGFSEQVYLFDPKYKLDGELDISRASRPLKVDVDKMHAYRDAIRGADGGRVVEYAAILYPGDSASFSGTIEALGARHSNADKLDKRLLEVFAGALA